jgi:asparagine synthase (glutamine-hydrolysing)
MSATAHGRFDPRSGELTLSPGWARPAAHDEEQHLAGELFRGERLNAPLRDGVAPNADGRYALAACDRAQRRLLLARDPAGSESLFWHRDAQGRVHFATGLDALVSQLPTRPGISPRGLDEFLRFLDIAAPNTIHDGVYALEAGAALVFDDAGVKTLPHAPPPPLPADYSAACDEVHDRLLAAIARRLDGARAPAAFLSGGVDSALLCALARHGGHAIDAWSVGFDDATLDESATAARIAAHLGLRHHVLRPDLDALEAVFERAHAQAEQPYCDPAGMPTRLLYEACAQQSDRALDGTGAEALAGLMPARWRRIAHDHVARIPMPLRRAVARTLQALPRVGGYARMFRFDVAQDLFIRWNGFTATDIARLTGRPADLSATRFYREHAALAGRSHLKRLSVLQGEAQPDDRIRQAALATGLRVEHPFGAADVNRLLQSLPEAWCWQPGREKRLLRDLLARHVPEAIWDTPKRGFNIDLVALLRGHDHRLVRRHLGETTAVERTSLDPAEVIRWRDRFIAGDAGAVHRVWGLINLAAWQAQHRS